ncbi:16320_t:CDS:2 [Funneliformis mosseae]|uniref:16320_t:CDS:1 n=1 Tax=Funneliformis mosseae TaxID=27381 RepID=A0A9N9HWD6_FUNMO|nr:16320_t:CDS:2 [Funneliformis mosseae]
MVSSETIANCWRKTNILSQETSLPIPIPIPDNENKIQELEELIIRLPGNDHLTVNDYIHIDDEVEGGLTDKEILEIIENEKDEPVDEIVKEVEKVTLTEAEMCIDKTLEFLYEQGLEFGEINEEIKILRNLHKRVKLMAVKNLKQVDLHYFENRETN